MKAEEARKITREHSKRIQHIYDCIEKEAKAGNSVLILNVSQANTQELDVLRSNGFTADYATSEIDGGQFIEIKWS